MRNVARKLYSRGLFAESTAFVPDSAARPVGQTPTIYASFNAERSATLHNNLRMRTSRTIIRPDNASRTPRESTVPDVRGVGLREALAVLEGAGYAVQFQGVGYVASQEPAAGATLPPGTKVTLHLRHLD